MSTPCGQAGPRSFFQSSTSMHLWRSVPAVRSHTFTASVLGQPPNLSNSSIGDLLLIDSWKITLAMYTCESIFDICGRKLVDSRAAWRMTFSEDSVLNIQRTPRNSGNTLTKSQVVWNITMCHNANWVIWPATLPQLLRIQTVLMIFLKTVRRLLTVRTPAIVHPTWMSFLLWPVRLWKSNYDRLTPQRPPDLMAFLDFSWNAVQLSWLRLSQEYSTIPSSLAQCHICSRRQPSLPSTSLATRVKQGITSRSHCCRSWVRSWRKLSPHSLKSTWMDINFFLLNSLHTTRVTLLRTLSPLS